jgi:hypothetical protein
MFDFSLFYSFLSVPGINAELFYVQKGVVNTYALNFVVMIPAHISDIQFSWQSLTNHSVSKIHSPLDINAMQTSKNVFI